MTNSTNSGGGLLSSLGNDHAIFSLIDAVCYTLVFFCLVLILKITLRLIARHASDDRLFTCFVATSVVLGFTGLAMVTTQAQMIGKLMLIPIFVIGVILIRNVCGTHYVRALIAMVVFSASAVAMTIGFQAVLDLYLPKDRVTMVKRIQISWGILDTFQGREGEAVFAKDYLKLAKAGLQIQAEAYVSAAALLRDHEALDRMVADHQSALAELGLLGGTNTIEDLIELGVNYPKDSAEQRGANVLKTAREKPEFTEQDVRDVVAFLKAARKDAKEITPEEAAMVIREAMKRKEALVILPTNVTVVASLPTNVVLSAPPPTTAPDTTTAAHVVVTSVDEKTSTTITNVPQGLGVEISIEQDPFAGLDDAEIKAWMNSKTALLVTAVMYYGETDFMAKVNDEMVRLGETVFAVSEGRYFKWRIVGAEGETVLWEPVIRRDP